MRGLALTPTCRSLQVELIIGQSVRKVKNNSPNQSASPSGHWVPCLSVVPSAPSLALGQASEQGPPIDATFPDLVETGNHPCTTIPSAPTGQRCCCYSRPGLQGPRYPSSTLLNPRPLALPPDFYTSILCSTPRHLVFRHQFLVLLLSSSTCSGPSCDRPLAQNKPICSSSCTE